MKKFLGILVIYLFWYNISSASTYKNDIFGLSNPDKQLVCDHDETSEISAWNFTDIKDEILGDWVMVRPLGVIKDKNNKTVNDSKIRGTITVVNKRLLPEATQWVQIFYNNKTLSIKSIALFGYINKNVSDEGFKLIKYVYKLKNSDRQFIKNVKEEIQKARLDFPKDITKADDIDARNFFIRVLAITKMVGQKEYDMAYDKTYNSKRSEYLCLIHEF